MSRMYSTVPTLWEECRILNAKLCGTFCNHWWLNEEYAVEQLVEALRYKPEDRGFDSRLSLEFFIDIILPATLWPWG